MYVWGLSSSELRTVKAVPLRVPALSGALLVGTSAITVAILAAVVASSPSPAASSRRPQANQMLEPSALVLAAPAAQSASAAPSAEDGDYLHVTARVGADLTEALRAAAVPERLGREYVALLSRAIPLAAELSVEDRFDLVYERGDQGRLLYAGLDRVARADIQLLKWTDGKETVWVNADAAAASGDNVMAMPVAGRVTSGFGKRFHPILGHARMHKGVDLRAPAGAPIVAADAGRVVAAGWHGGYGRQVRIAHAGGLETTYSHMSRIAARPGGAVSKGQVIGYVGSSGLSTGPHLHYEIYKNGRPVNPMSVKTGAQARLEGQELHALRSELRKLLTN